MEFVKQTSPPLWKTVDNPVDKWRTLGTTPKKEAVPIWISHPVKEKTRKFTFPLKAH